MDLNQFAIFGMLRKRMDWLTERQSVLAQNLANSDTPNYKAKDMAPPNFKRVLEAQGITDRPGALRAAGSGAGGSGGGSQSGPVHLATTNPGHIVGKAVESRTAPRADVRGSEASPSGNDVNVEDQVSKVTETQMDFQMTANLYHKHLAMLKSVLRR